MDASTQTTDDLLEPLLAMMASRQPQPRSPMRDLTTALSRILMNAPLQEDQLLDEATYGYDDTPLTAQPTFKAMAHRVLGLISSGHLGRSDDDEALPPAAQASRGRLQHSQRHGDDQEDAVEPGLAYRQPRASDSHNARVDNELDDSTFVYDALPEGMLPLSVASTIQSMHPIPIYSAASSARDGSPQVSGDDSDDLAPCEPVECYVQRVTSFSSQYGVNRYGAARAPYITLTRV